MMRAICLRILVFLLFTLRSSCDQAWVDPFDMTGDTGEPRIIPEKRPPQMSPQPSAKPAESIPSRSGPVCPASKEGIDYRTYYRQLVHHLWSKISGARRKEGKDLLADVRIMARAEHVLDAFVKDNSEDAVQEVNEAFDSIFHNFRSVQEPSVSGLSRWLEPDHLREVLTYAILGLVLGFLVLPMVLIVRSNFSGFVRFFLTVFYLSWLWAWIVLFKKEVAKRRSAVASQVKMCGEETWLVTLGHYFASFLVVVPDHCAALYEHMEVESWLEVTPMRALVYMLTQMVLEPSRPLADNLVHFVRTVCGGLPVPHAIGALLVTTFIVVLLLTFCFGYRIRIPLLLAVEPAERSSSSSPAESEERLAALIRSTMERQHSVMMEQTLVTRRSSMRADRILAGRRRREDGRGTDVPVESLANRWTQSAVAPRESGDGPLDAESSSDSTGPEEFCESEKKQGGSARPPETLT